MKQNGRTINSYFIFIILLVMVIVGLNLLSNREEDYTRAEFIADLDAGNVSEIEYSRMEKPLPAIWRSR